MRIGSQVFVPQSAVLSCLTCERRGKPRKVVSQHGRCRCGEGAWLLTAHYVLAVENSHELGFGLDGFELQRVTHTQSADPELAPLDEQTALWLCDPPASFLQRVSELFVDAGDAELEERKQALLAAGGCECAGCGRVFTPNERRPPSDYWTADGCCSRLCWARAHPDRQPPGADPAEPARPRAAGIAVTCAAGHEFEVPAMYAGTRRPCPTCGQKTPIP